MSESKTILIVDDDPVAEALFRAILEPQGYEVVVFGKSMSAIDYIWRTQPAPSLVLAGFGLDDKDITGLKIIGNAREHWGDDVRVAIITGGFTSKDQEKECREAKVPILTKPWKSNDELIEFIEEAMTRQNAELIAA